MVPSESLPSPLARLSLASACVNRYLFQHKDYDGLLCPGTTIIQKIYRYCQHTISNLLNAKYVSLKALSGMNCMTMVIGSFSRPGGNVMTIPIPHGGHTHTERILRQMGRTSSDIPYSIRDEWYNVDIPKLGKIVSRCSPDLIYFDPMIYLYEEDLRQIRNIVPSSTHLHYDCSHVLALVAGNMYVNPLDVGFDSISGSTHKTLPGTQKGFFATNNKAHHETFHRVGESMVSSIHAASILGLAVTLSEISDCCTTYARQIVMNCHTLAECFEQQGFGLVGRRSHRSDNHVLLLNTQPYSEPTNAARKLSQVGVIVHPMKFPDPYGRKGLRLGIQEITWLGMRESEMEDIANLFSRLLISGEEETSIREDVAHLRSRYIWSPWACLDVELRKKLFNAMFGSASLFTIF